MRIAIFAAYGSAMLAASIAVCAAAGAVPLHRNPKYLNESTARIDKFDGVLIAGDAENRDATAEAFGAVMPHDRVLIVAPDAPDADVAAYVAGIIASVRAGEQTTEQAIEDTAASSSSTDPSADSSTEPVVDSSAVPDEPPGTVLTAEEVAAMDYNTVRSLAKKCQVPAGGSRDEIAARLVGVTVPA